MSIRGLNLLRSSPAVIEPKSPVHMYEFGILSETSVLSVIGGAKFEVTCPFQYGEVPDGKLGGCVIIGDEPRLGMKTVGAGPAGTCVHSK